MKSPRKAALLSKARPLQALLGVLAVALLSSCMPGQPVRNPNATSVASASPTSTPTLEPGPVDRPTYPPVDVKPEGFVAAPAGAGLEGYLQQKVNWEECDDGQCANVVAPLDYNDPTAQAITLSMKRIKATKKPRLGTLFINPGGPGASGKEEVSTFQNDRLKQYDILGWDPRGVGDSTPVVCEEGSAIDQLLALDMSPDTPEERDELVKAYTEFGKSCWEKSGVLLEHISTVESAKDLDLIRQLVGDVKLNYLGYSYGTQLGATYAELFGANISRMVLDAAVDITDNEEIIQAMGFDTALKNFAKHCVETKCELGSSSDKVLKTITDFLEKLDAEPLKVGKRYLTQSLAAAGIGLFLYAGKEGWSLLQIAIISAKDNEDGTMLLWAGETLNGREDNGKYSSLFYAFQAISCLDYRDKGLAASDEDWTRDQQKAPIFGKYFGPQYTCAVWPVPPVPQLQITAPDAPPLLVIGGTGDNATPYQQAVDMAKQMKSAILVTYDGEGHGSFGGKSTCIDKLVSAYLNKGTLPKDGVTCK